VWLYLRVKELNVKVSITVLYSLAGPCKNNEPIIHVTLLFTLFDHSTDLVQGGIKTLNIYKQIENSK
jgi:hypothetical protein